MNIQLTEKQKEIVKSLRLKSSDVSQTLLGELEEGRFTMAHIEGLCTLINDEFMMEGILANFEPNGYGRELEALLDLVNRARIKS